MTSRKYRVNLAMDKELNDMLKDQAWKEHKSVNQFCIELIERYLQSNGVNTSGRRKQGISR